MSRSHSPSSSPVVLQARGVERTIDGATVLAAVDCTVAPGSVLGIVGPNGVGKSTLLRVLAGLDPPTAGSVSLTPPDATVALLAQEPDHRPDETVRTTLARRTGVAAAQAELDRSTDALATDAGGVGDGRTSHDDGAADRYDAALTRWMALGGHDFDARLETVAAAIGLGEDVLDRRSTVLSGGESARVSLAAVLLSQVDVLLLDEPSNNLDAEGLSRLEDFIAERRPGGTALVSHDRVLLERTVTDVLEIDEHDRGATHYGGGWAAYQEEKATRRRRAEEEYRDYRSQHDQLRRRAQTQREWASKGLARARKNPSDGDKFIRNHKIDQSEKQAGKARATEEAIRRLAPVAKPWEGWDLRYTMATTTRSGDDVVTLTGALARRGDFTLGPVDLLVSWGERIALIGPNGSGKSTLLAMMLGSLELDQGRRRIGPAVVVGELDQRRLGLDPDRPVARAFADRCDLPKSEARSVLAKFGLTADHVRRSSTTMSPGERTRAQLAEFAVRGVNLLVLDEPTNHLDLPAIEQLELALAGYDGTLVLVTHDRAMLDAVTLTRTIDLTRTGRPG